HCPLAPKPDLPQVWLSTLAGSRRLKCRFISDRRARWSLCKRQQNRSQCRGGLVGLRLLVDRELEVRKPRQPFFHTENAQARDQRAGRKRGDGEARERRRAHARQTGAGIDDLPGQFVVVERGECSLARNGSLAVQGQRQRRTRNKIERVGRGPDQRLTPHQTPFRGSERALCEHNVKPPRIELLDQFRADADLHLELHARMELAKRPSAEGSEPPATSSTTPRRAVPDSRGAARRCRAASSNCNRRRASPSTI